MKKTRLAQAKGELRITRADGSVETVSQTQATQDARRAVNKRDRELQSPRTLAVDASPAQPIDQGIEARERQGVRADLAIEIVRDRQRAAWLATRPIDPATGRTLKG